MAILCVWEGPGRRIVEHFHRHFQAHFAMGFSPACYFLKVAIESAEAERSLNHRTKKRTDSAAALWASESSRGPWKIFVSYQ